MSSVEGAHLVIVPLVVIPAVSPDVLLVGDVAVKVLPTANGEAVDIPVEGAAHLVSVQLVVVLVVPPGVLVGHVTADISAVGDGEAMADVLATADGEAVSFVFLVFLVDIFISA